MTQGERAGRVEAALRRLVEALEAGDRLAVLNATLAARAVLRAGPVELGEAPAYDRTAAEAVRGLEDHERATLAAWNRRREAEAATSAAFGAAVREWVER